MLERICVGLLILVGICLLAGAFLSLADWIMGIVCRVFPEIDEWIDSLPMGH